MAAGPALPLEGHCGLAHLGRVLARRAQHRHRVFRQDGQGLARGGRWPLDRHPLGRPLGRGQLGPRSRPTGAASSPPSSDKTARVWREGADGRWTGTPPGRPLGRGQTRPRSRPTGAASSPPSSDKTARVWQIEWLLSDDSRAWVSAHGEGPRLGLLVKSSCAEKLNGTERRIVDSEGREVGKESVRRLTHEDVLAAPILSGQEGEDVCDWQLPMLDRVTVWRPPCPRDQAERRYAA